MELFNELTYWHWLGLGLILLILEVLVASGGFLLWIGLAAIIIAAISWLIPSLFWGIQVVIFAGASIACLLGWWSYIQRNPTVTDQPKLNRRGEHYVGRIFTLETAIDNGRGTIKVDDSIWRVAGQDLPAGARVKVIAVEGVILKVEPA